MTKVHSTPNVHLTLTGVTGDDALLQSFADTAAHMLQTVVDALRLFQQLPEYNRQHGTAILESDLEGCDVMQVALVMFIHDFYKPKQSAAHAENGARFLDDVVTGLIRHHDKFGIQHTGEASILALADVVDWLQGLSEQARSRALAMLPVVTMLDVGSLGFLNQPRVETYRQLRSNLQSVLSGANRLEELARADTACRIQRLIQSNNRAAVDAGLIQEVLRAFPNLDRNLPPVRFDAGVYVLEPLMLYLIGEPYDFPTASSAAGIQIGPGHRQQLACFLGALDTLADEAVATGHLTVDLGLRSLKPGPGLPERRIEFDTWAAAIAGKQPDAHAR